MTPPTPAVTVVVADDEPLARRKIRDFLANADAVSLVGEATTGSETVALVNRLRPDVLFLDVRMPGLDGFQVLERLDYDPVVVFTTAHEDYAVAAFEVRALDYLLKPFGRTRFLDALKRAREAVRDPSRPSHRARGREVLDPARPLRQLFIRTPRGILPVDVGEILRFEGCDDYVTIHARGKRFLAAVTLDDLETLLDPARFLRIHRSHIVNLRDVTAMTPDATGRLVVTMKDDTALFASRARSREIRRRAV